MATKLKRSLFIGLGGTGMKSILKTKQLYKNAFGEVPQIIGFLGIDTSTEEFAKELVAKDSSIVRLNNEEQIKMTMTGPLDYYNTHKDRFNWIHQHNVNALSGLSANGAGQIRTNGRFSFTINYAQVESGIRNAVDNVSNATNDGKGKWELVDDKIQIYLVFSLSGGTGCGIFLNVAYLIKEMYGDNCVLQAYSVLPNAFVGCGQFVGANAYGAMLDADYLMSHTGLTNPFVYSLLDEDRRTFFRPFDLVYMIDNVNKNGDKYKDANQLYDMIGQALLAISGSIGSASAADVDNFKQLMIDGSLDIEDKKAWISGMGLCEILVNTDKLSKRYGLRAAQKLVSLMQGSSDPNKISDATETWISVNSIKEHEDDQLLDSLYDLSKLPQSSIVSRKSDDAAVESSSYVEDTINQASKAIAANYAEKLFAVKKSFNAKLSDIIKTNGGLESASAFIVKLTDALNLYLAEMREELVKIDADRSTFKTAIDDILTEWKNAWVNRQSFKDDLAEAQRAYVANEVENNRREKAKQFFLELKEYVSSFEASIALSKNSLKTVADVLREKLSNLEYTKNDVSPFQIDLAADYVLSGEDDTDCTVTAFAKTLVGEDVLSIKDMSSTEIIDRILSFTGNLAGADFRSLSLESMILKMSDEEKRRLIGKALRKAEIVLEIKPNGYNKEGALRNALYVSMSGGKEGALARDGVIKSMLEAETGLTKPTFADSPTDKSIMIFRQKGVFPVFQIAAIERQKLEYEKHSERKCFSFDAGLHATLEDIRYSFMPNQQKDEVVLEMWVKGLIHGLIQHEGSRYTVWSKTLGDSAEDYMLKLKAPEEGKGTEARFFAFEDFKSKKKDLNRADDLMGRIKDIELSMGRAQITELYKHVAELKFDDYVKEVSKLNIDPGTIKKNLSYTQTLAIIKDEDKYRTDKLLNSIQ